MPPPMHKRVLNYFNDAALTSGYLPQLLVWNDTGKLTDNFMVFRPNGGGPVRNQLGGDYYVMVDVIGAKGANGAVDERVQAIIDFVQQNPMVDGCVGYLENLGGIPAPVQTTEGRLVYRLQFVATFGS
ncbi:phage tail termination protein [Erwinia aphidicola]|uniref:phage tail termination protein n=1 Tax=Erwinia aphidicola TaxID=68334 RepID=UPI003D22A264